jgi:hypothetical protein
MPYIGNTVQNQGFTPAIDYFSGNGVTVTFTLSRPVVGVAQMIVAVDNVIQNPSTAFTVSGSSITFTSAPLSGTNNIWVEYTSLITTYNAISQDPSVIGDITASGGYLATGDFGNSYIDGVIVDYVTGAARLTTGPLDDMIFYHGGSSSRSEMLKLSYAGSSKLTGNLGVNVTPNTWTLGNAVSVGDVGSSIFGFNGYNSITAGTYYNSGWKCSNSTNKPTVFAGGDGVFNWYVAPVGTTGNAAALTSILNLNANGVLALNGANTIANGVGIAFPGTQSASTDPNTLDDYEEGTWTPEIWTSSAQITSPTAVTGTYIKIGRVLYIQGYWYKASGNSGGAAGYTLKGLPFALSANYDFIPLGYNAVNGSVSTQPGRFQANASSFCEMYGQFSGTTWSSSYMEMSFCGVLRTLS